MSMSKKRLALAGTLILMSAAPAVVQAQFAVIDVGAIAQLIQQVSALQEQLRTTQDHLTQSRLQYASMTGGRGMEGLLGNVPRNYLPPNWVEMENILRNASVTYNSIANRVNATANGNAVLTPAQLARFSVETRTLLEEGRRAAALMQVMSREGLANTSGRFASLQQLINAISTATDSKAILDLQARIQAEQGMLQNEQTKLQMLFQAAQAQEWARQQREREYSLAMQGRFDTRFRPTFP